MKKTYISLSTTVADMLSNEILLSTSPSNIDYGGTGNGSDEAVKGAGEDNTPWYRR